MTGVNLSGMKKGISVENSPLLSQSRGRGGRIAALFESKLVPDGSSMPGVPGNLV